MNINKAKEITAKILFTICAIFSVIAVFGIIFYILWQSIPAFQQIGVFNFLFGTQWTPSRVDIFGIENSFGIFPMILGSIVVTFGAVLIGGAIGVFTAIFMVYYCPRKIRIGKVKLPIRAVFEQVINLLAGIPSIVYGVFGLLVIVPFFANLTGTTGKGSMSAALVLALMILPTVAGMAKNALMAVPSQYYEGALAMGNTKEQAVFKVLVPAAKNGILSGLILGIGRAIGETMAVIMVVGNGTKMSNLASLFKPIRTLTVNIVMEMGYAEGLHRQALIATGFVLLCFVLIINLCLISVTKDKKERKKKGRALKGDFTHSVKYVRQGVGEKILKYVSIVLACFVAVALIYLIVYILSIGIPNLSWDLLFGPSGNANTTLRPAFVTTAWVILITLAIALPLGIGAAIYLNEYAKKGNKFVKVIRMFTDTLAGIPSIVFGLFGFIFFNQILGLGYSILSGSFTMVIIILPTIIRSTETGLQAVPDSLREGSYGLGAGKLRTILKIVLPQALPSIVTAIILSVGRIVGESAALIYTAGAVAQTPSSPLDAGATFAVMMWRFFNEGLYMEKMYATAVVLIVIVIFLNALASFVEYKFKSRSEAQKVKKGK